MIACNQTWKKQLMPAFNSKVFNGVNNCIKTSKNIDVFVEIVVFANTLSC